MKKLDLFKQKRIYIVLLLAVLLSVLCIIKIATPKQQYSFSGERIFDNGVKVTNEIIYDQISLPAGVYDVKLKYQTDTSFQNLCSVQDPAVFTGGLLTNFEELFKNRNETDYRMWLYESTETLQITILYGGVGRLVTGDLLLCETNALWTMSLAVIWSIAILLIVFFAYRNYDALVGIEKEKKSVVMGVLLITFIASIPYLCGYGWSCGDLGYHLHRIEGVKDGILSGQFPLRIEPEWLFGHGYANGVFYCNTLLYFPAILRLLGFNVSVSYNIYCIALNFVTTCISYFCFSRIFKNRYIGLLCSALYTLSIFRMNKLLIVAAVGEAGAYTFLPLILYGLYRAFSEDVNSRSYKTVWIPIAVGYAGVIQTHVLSCEIAAFLTIVVCLIFIKKIFVKQTFLELAKGALAACAASFWYLIPFIDYYVNENLHIRHVSARTIQERGLYWQQLLFHWWSPESGILESNKMIPHFDSIGVGIVLVISVILFCGLWLGGKFRQKGNSVLTLGKFASIFACVFMLMSLNVFPWDAIQKINNITATLVSSLQFPSRFLAWGTVFLVAVCGSLLYYLKSLDKKWYYSLGVACVLISLFAINIHFLDYINYNKQPVYLYNEEGQGFGYISGAEYIVEGTDYVNLDFGVPVASEDVEIISYDKEYLHVWTECVNNGSDEGYIELPLLHYTGYRAFVTSTGEELLTMKGTNNVVRVLLPAGFTDEIEVKFVSPVHWRISEGVTYFWWIFIGVNLVMHKLHKRKEKNGKVCVV